MTDIYTWATSICICAAICMLIELIAPNGSMDKILKFILGVFILCCTIIPLKSVATGINEQLISININNSVEDYFPNDIENISENITRESITQVVEQQLSLIDCSAKDIEIITKTENERVVISKIIVTVDSSYKEDVYKIKSSLEESLNLDVDVKI